MRKVSHNDCRAFIFRKVSLIIRWKIITKMVEIMEMINYIIITINCFMKRVLKGNKKHGSMHMALTLGEIDLCFYIGLVICYYIIFLRNHNANNNIYTETSSRAVAVCGTIFATIFGAVFGGMFVAVSVKIFRLSLVHRNMMEVYLDDTVEVMKDMMEMHIPVVHMKDVSVVHRTDHRKEIVQNMEDMLVQHQQKNIAKVMDDVMVVDLKDVVVVRTKDLVQFITDMMVVHNKIHMKGIVMARKDVLVLYIKDMMEDGVKEYIMKGYMKRFLLFLYKHLISLHKNNHFTK